MTYFSFPLPKVPDTQDPKLTEALQPIYNALFAIYNDFVYSCGAISPPSSEYERLVANPDNLLQPQNLNRLICTAKENLAFGSMIALEDVAGVVKAKLAKGGTTPIRAIGYCNTPGGVLAEDKCEVIVVAGLLAVSGATVGTVYYLSAAAGSISTAAPTSGLVQWVGFGVAPGLVYINCMQYMYTI